MIYKVAIIGAGPAGISTAIEAIAKGVKPEEILFLEKFSEILHSIKVKYPASKPVLANYKGIGAQCFGEMCITDMTKDEFVHFMEQRLIETNIEINYGQELKSITKTKNGYFSLCTQNDCFFARTIFVAIGNMSTPRALGIPVDEKIYENIRYDVNNIEKENAKILVVGGGDSASEYAQYLIDQNHNVTLSYRKNNFARMIDSNLEITQRLESEGSLKVLKPTNLTRVDERNGQCHVSFDQSQFDQDFDYIVAAIGGENPREYLKVLNINLDAEDSSDFVETDMEGLFVLGDLAAGKRGGSIIKAFNSAHFAMKEAQQFYL